MAAHGICDRVAIIAMGCTDFGEHWDRSADDLLIEAVNATTASAGVTLHDIDAFWLGTYMSGVSGLSLSRPLRLHGKPVSRVENMCATGSEALRNACYAVASGAYDTVMAGRSRKAQGLRFLRSAASLHTVRRDWWHPGNHQRASQFQPARSGVRRKVRGGPARA